MRFKNPPIIFGEILMDCFPDGSRVLGGCALNVAWHLQGLKLNPLLISGVGIDPLGRETRELISKWGLNSHYITENPHYPTGTVLVTLDAQGNAKYESAVPTAFDYLKLKNPPLANESILYYGTFGIRSTVTRDLVRVIRKSAKKVYVDMNLRPPHYDLARIEEVLVEAHWVKVNEEEFEICFGLKATFENAKRVARERKIPCLLVTCAERGAFAVEQNLHGAEIFEVTYTPNSKPIVDTIGAGDAFSAAFIARTYEGDSTEFALKWACEFARQVCFIKGATPQALDFYRDSI